MTFCVELPYYMTECPVWWINYIRYIKQELLYEHGDARHRLLNKKLNDYGAVYKGRLANNIPNSLVIFNTEEDAIAFILRWA